MNKMLIIGDVHSNYKLLWHLLDGYKNENVDVVLQLGDLGLYTTKHAAHQDKKAYKHNPTLISRFIKDYEESIIKKLPIPIYFIKGNHDDYDMVQKMQDLNIFYLPTSQTVLKGFDILAIGGIFSPIKISWKNNDLTGRNRRFFTNEDITKVKKCKNIDIMISHQGAHSVMPLNEQGRDEGIKHITEVLDKVKPSYYIHGHHHIDYMSTYDQTTVYGLGNFGSNSKSFLVAEKENDKITIIRNERPIC